MNHDDTDDDDEDIVVPNTGTFTSEGGSAELVFGFISSIVIGAIITTKWILARKKEQE